MIELSRSQDESVGDGTTSVVILAGELLQLSAGILARKVHPTVLISAYSAAMEDALAALARCAVKIDLTSRDRLHTVVRSCLGTKFVAQYGDLMVDIALDAVRIVAGPQFAASTAENAMDVEESSRANALLALAAKAGEVDLKKYARVEKIPGGDITESRVFCGVILNKDVTHSKMRRQIDNPRVILLDCTLEYKKGESQTNVECTNVEDFEKLLRAEEEDIKELCEKILRFKPDVVCTEKGLSDLAQHYLLKGGVTAFRRLRKTDNNRLARVSGATIVHRPDEIQESDVGTLCQSMEVQKIGDEYFTFFFAKSDADLPPSQTSGNATDRRACTILLRGASKDVLNEVERNLWDAMCVARNIVLDPRLVPGGGASEMAVATTLAERAKQISGVRQQPYRNVGLALEVIPRTLLQNCGADVVRAITALRAKHAQSPTENWTWGVDGNKGVLVDMREMGLWEPYEVKAQTIKSAVEAACLLLRVDDILSGVGKKKDGPEAQSGAPEQAELMEPGM